MIAGIELFALGVEEVIGHVDEPLAAEAQTALFGGVALYLLAHVAFKWRTTRSLGVQRLWAALVLLVFVPLGADLDALLALAVVTAVSVALIAYEVIRFREARARVRVAA